MNFFMAPDGELQSCICSQCRPKYVYKDGKATSEQVKDEHGVPVWRLCLMYVTDSEAGTFWVSYSSKEEPPVPSSVYGVADGGIYGRTYGQRGDNITMTLDPNCKLKPFDDGE